MIQQKKATDKALYRRALKAVERGDESMRPVVTWYERGKKPLPKGTQAHRDAREVLIELKKEHTFKELSKAFDTYEPLLYRLVNEDYNNVPRWKAKVIAGYNGETIPKISDNRQQEWEQYRKAQKILQEQYTGRTTYRKLGAKYGLDKGETAKCIRDEYKRPHTKIIEAVTEG